MHVSILIILEIVIMFRQVFSKTTFVFSMNGNGLITNGGQPYNNDGYDAHKNQQTLNGGGYAGNGAVDIGGSAEFKYPHLQLRDVSCDVRSESGGWETLLNSISLEARGGEIIAILSTKCKLALH